MHIPQTQCITNQASNDTSEKMEECDLYVAATAVTFNPVVVDC